MTFLSSTSRFTYISLAGALALGLATLSGCGNQPLVLSTPVDGNLINGRSMGGETPVTGASVTLYASAPNSSISNGVYVGTATVLGTTTSLSDGSFSFNPSSYTCPPNQELYIVSTGGDAGAGANANVVEVAMIGQCGSLNGFTDVNELTTLAAAYAFSSFMTVDTSGAAPVVNITAPAANASFASSNNVASGTATTASGLLHAYQNAINLVDPTHGIAYAVPPSNPNGVAPNALLNTLGNVLQACVNSTGGTANDPTPCGKLFGLSPSLSGAFPTTTLQAALNIARNPWVSAANVTSLFNLATPQVAFAPILSAAPKDWTVAISYPVPANPPTGLGFPFTLALDANDNVYVTSPENDVYAGVSLGSYLRSSKSSCLFGYSSNGDFLPSVTPYSGAPGSGTPGTSSWYCASGATATNPDLFTQLATDALGNVWIANLGSTNTENVLVKVNTSSPASATPYTTTDTFAPKTIAVDKENDVFFAHLSSSSTTQSVFYLTANGATGPTASFFGTPVAQIAQAANWLALDGAQNLWATGYSDTSSSGYGGSASLLPYTGTAGSPSYGGSWQKKAIAGGSTTTSASNSAPFGLALDSAGNAWFTSDWPGTASSSTTPVGLTEAVVTAGALQTTPAANTITTLGLVSPKFLEADGNNVMWVADTGGIVAYSTTATPVVGEISESGGFNPCIPSGTTCTYPDNASTKGIAIDSTGSVWWTTPDLTTTNTNANRLIQMIGTATATWPLLATGKPGTMPQ
jgi:hypothetical protein